MKIGRFLKERWLDARFGLIYAGFFLSFVTASTVTYADIPQVHSLFPSISVYFGFAFVIGGLIVSPAIGYLHRKHQNPTDIELANAPLFEEIRRIVREELIRLNSGDTTTSANAASISEKEAVRLDSKQQE